MKRKILNHGQSPLPMDNLMNLAKNYTELVEKSSLPKNGSKYKKVNGKKVNLMGGEDLLNFIKMDTSQSIQVGG